MASTLSDLKKQAAQLTDLDVEEAWIREIERRVRQVDEGEAERIPAEEVFARIRRRLG